MLNTTLLLSLYQKTYHMRYEKIILGRIRCEKASQVVRACYAVILRKYFDSQILLIMIMEMMDMLELMRMTSVL